MEQRWYYEDHGRAKGPVSTSELLRRIQKGEMTLMDLIFKDGETQWMPAQSYSEITEAIGNITLNQASDWIVLRSVNVDGRTINEQIGPFNAQQILDLIDRGKILFSDYVWRTGYEKWVPLGRVDQFEAPLRTSVDVDKSLYEKPRRDALLDARPVPLKKVTVTAAVPEPVRPEEKPLEAKGEDLAGPKRVEVIQRSEVIVEKPKPKPVEKKTEPVEKKTEPAPAKKADTKKAAPLDEETVVAARLTPVPPAPPAKVENKKVDPIPLKKVEAKKMPPLPETQNQKPPEPEQKFPIFDEPLTVEEKKPHRVAPQMRPTVEVKPVVTEIRKSTVAPVPEPVTKTDIPVAHVQKIKASEILAAEVPKPIEKQKPIDKPSVSSDEATDLDITALRSRFSQRWLQATVGAGFVVILTLVSLIYINGKKQSNDIGIKINPPSEETRAQAQRNNPPPKMENVELPPEVKIVPKKVVEVAKTSPVPAVQAANPTAVKNDNTAAAGTESATNIDSASNASVDKSYNPTPTIGGSPKNRSYYHHKERIYLFYTASEGEALSNDLQRASSKHAKNSKNWKTFYSDWKGKSNKYVSKVAKEAKKARLHRALFKQLLVSAGQMDDLGRDLNAQISDGRGPSKVASAKSIETQFKSINSNARALDR